MHLNKPRRPDRLASIVHFASAKRAVRLYTLLCCVTDDAWVFQLYATFILGPNMTALTRA